jgi:hypothetical protein
VFGIDFPFLFGALHFMGFAARNRVWSLNSLSLQNVQSIRKTYQKSRISNPPWAVQAQIVHDH